MSDTAHQEDCPGIRDQMTALIVPHRRSPRPMTIQMPPSQNPCRAVFVVCHHTAFVVIGALCPHGRYRAVVNRALTVNRRSPTRWLCHPCQNGERTRASHGHARTIGTSPDLGRSRSDANPNPSDREAQVNGYLSGRGVVGRYVRASREAQLQ